MPSARTIGQMALITVAVMFGVGAAVRAGVPLVREIVG